MKKIANPLRPVYDLANEYTSKRTFPDNPLYMDVELTNLCNEVWFFRKHIKQKTNFF